MREDSLLNEALSAFQKETGLVLEIQGYVASPGAGRDGGSDALVKLQDTGVVFHAGVRHWVGHMNTGVLFNQFRRLPIGQAGLLVADYINPNLADRLRAQGIQFIDTAGNAFVHSPPIHIFIKGNRKPRSDLMEPQVTGRAFRSTGLKVIFALLNDPALLNASYRELAEQARVSLGSIGGIFLELIKLGYVEIEVLTERKRIAQPHKLMEKWVEAYPVNLRRKLILGQFVTSDLLAGIDPVEYGGCWGGESAASRYDHYLMPGEAMIYLDKGKLEAFLRKARLRKLDTVYNQTELKVLVLEKFWNTAINSISQELAPPLLVYADLVETATPRNLEAAERIRERYLD